MKQSFLEQVSQCQTKTPSGFFLPCQLDGDFVSPYPRPQSKDMCIGSHLHGHNVMIFHHLLSQLTVNFLFSRQNLYAKKGALNDTTTKRNRYEARTPGDYPPD